MYIETRPLERALHVPFGTDEYRGDDPSLLLGPKSRDLMELEQVHRIADHLISVGTSESRALELDNEQRAIGEKNAVHA
jgi:hypothetical protein